MKLIASVTGGYRTSRPSFMAATLLLSMCALSCLASPVHYKFVDLGTLGGAESRATAINSKGQVTGQAQTKRGLWRAFRYERGRMEDLGNWEGTYSKGQGINDLGDVIGTYYSKGEYQHTEVYQGPYDQWTSGLGGDSSNGWGINNHSQVTGSAEARTKGDWEFHAYLARRGRTPTHLKPLTRAQNLASSSIPYSVIDLNRFLPSHSSWILSCGTAINRYGDVADWGFRRGKAHDFRYHTAFLYHKGRVIDLAASGSKASEALALNSRREVTGWSMGPDGQKQAFLYRRGRVRHLGTLRGYQDAIGRGINDSGEIVGLCRRHGGIPHAFLWRNGHMTDLNRAGLSASGWTLTEAVGINASGQIVGTGFRDHRSHAFLLTPLPLSTARR